MWVMMTKIKTIEGGQKSSLLTRGDKKKTFLTRKTCRYLCKQTNGAQIKKIYQEHSLFHLMPDRNIVSSIHRVLLYNSCETEAIEKKT